MVRCVINSIVELNLKTNLRPLTLVTSLPETTFIRRHDGDGDKETKKDDKEAVGGETRFDPFSDSEVFYEGAQNAEVALVLLDRGTGWVQVVPQATKSAEHTAQALRQFAGTNKI